MEAQRLGEAGATGEAALQRLECTPSRRLLDGMAADRWRHLQADMQQAEAAQAQEQTDRAAVRPSGQTGAEMAAAAVAGGSHRLHACDDRCS